MAKEKNFSFAPLPSFSPKPEPTPLPNAPVIEGVTKVTFDCPNGLLEAMKDFGYWEGLTQKDIILESLEIFFDGKEIRVRPDKVKARPKVGRKPKTKA
jgi:hypothetical protein